MLNKRLFVRLILISLLCLSAFVCAQTLSFTPPRERSQLAANKPWPKNHFLVLAYHDVEDAAADQRYLSVRTSALNEQISWLLHNGYNAISIQDILDAHHGKKTLPPKAFLLTFDDGYSSFYTRVWPLLQAWNVPALWAPVGSWVDTPANHKVNFGGLMTSRERFATWDMVRELSQSPLVEIGSHTWASHYGILANPQGSREPAIANRFYDKATRHYETDQQFTQRITNDVRKVTDKIAQVTGKAPRAWVWPYGAANGISLSVINKQGYQLAFTLEDGLANVQHLDNIPRLLISGNPSIKAFASAVTRIQELDPVRVMHVDLDYVYDHEPIQQTKNIDKLVQRVYDMKITHVFLQAFSDPHGDGRINSLYFPNRRLPVRADLFNFVSWQLQTRAGVKVFAWMPVLSFNLDPSLPRVQRWNKETGQTQTACEPYIRLSPWDEQTRHQITEIYEDLARYAPFNGILFHDDAVLTDFEDAGPGAMRAWNNRSIAAMLQDQTELQAWSRFKSQTLITFTHALSQAVKSIRGPQIKTARNMFALPILEPESESWFAQNLDDFLAAYDWTVPMAMPLMESVPAEESHAWLRRLVSTIAARPGALDKTIIELQARDWSQKPQRGVPDQRLVEWMRVLQLSGIKNYGYYPDDFINNQPDISRIRPEFSSYWYPDND
ncbi:TPA: poly-beta-1,6-N-acetyl-D-glucosamine N-deacetylase PgaB [Escherichia coli]|uniref:Poly-beta-1,6-N-acetyl-D-glucosamine N-deacetylase PgaB n=3 Tax=Escherichia TaxID=561 RepID=A0ABU1C2A4_9ESCH|nr:MULTISPECIES: poly-beta-1,6-N-acetyl-D-glucosamine N-deacetylase PgaB [Escherichia]EHK5028257.1 poly-beta-1,6-N-acetyl-D-glucosamine N-deacetylase PgaB [Escherichia coli]MCE2417981.1 poly-beta-1,6-N-acetyl-D-glucosamine N-deacetylase PgaB [Escherichia coli]MCO1154160.1 poly-beta-1,6-N-acetyl-D-glucosamine N-deacetylase PgaB [Escherichia coli]MDQ9213540.1 poly-beta-1,6-N-acetyl-D-glucosamine N-deacetylase PgaB [Escherichia marmotae]MDQ9227568.1 poly-beta-1,6-N-acetyl-D-glucosamine N-deacetyl